MTQQLSDQEISGGMLIAQPRRVETPTYRITPAPQMPERMRVERRGLFGFWDDRQEAAHQRRMNSIAEKILEAEHGARGALALDTTLVKASGDAAEAMQDIVEAYAEGGIGERVTSDLTGVAIARNRLRVAAVSDAVDSHILNVLQRS
jgi:hypothetical protein